MKDRVRGLIEPRHDIELRGVKVTILSEPHDYQVWVSLGCEEPPVGCNFCWAGGDTAEEAVTEAIRLFREAADQLADLLRVEAHGEVHGKLQAAEFFETVSAILEDRPVASTGEYVHVTWCNASRHQPVGNDMCVCPIGRRIKALKGEAGRSAPEPPTPKRSCMAPAPDRSTRTCDRPEGHDGPHWTYGMNTLTWESAPEPPTQRCDLCSIDDGLVREWVSKARAVAKSKGLLGAAPEPPPSEARDTTTISRASERSDAGERQDPRENRNGKALSNG